MVKNVIIRGRMGDENLYEIFAFCNKNVLSSLFCLEIIIFKFI